MNLSEFYSRYNDEQNCIQFLKKHLEKTISCCPKCTSKKICWKTNFVGWRCNRCSARISMKSISFMRDSNLTFAEWMEIIYLVLNGKKTRSISEILRLSKQTRHDTVSYAVKKIRQELSKNNIKKSSHLNDLLLFDHQSDEVGTNSLDSPGIPISLVLYIQKSPNNRKDNIQVELYGKYKIEALKLKVSRFISTNYRHKKLCHIKIKTEKSPSIPSKINRNWKRKIQENLIKNIKGLHHNVSILFIQGILNEYCFKYNHRHSNIDRMNEFMRICTI